MTVSSRELQKYLPPETSADDVRPGSRVARRALGLTICVLLAATPLLLASSAEYWRPWREEVAVTAPYRAVETTTTRIANGNLSDVQRPIRRLSTRHFMIYGALSVAAGIYALSSRW